MGNLCGYDTDVYNARGTPSYGTAEYIMTTTATSNITLRIYNNIKISSIGNYGMNAWFDIEVIGGYVPVYQ